MPLPASYATVANVLATYPPVGSVTAITSSQIAEAIGAEQAHVDARLAQRYAVPFSPVPPLIETIVRDLTVYRLLAHRMFTQHGENKSEWVDAWKERADGYLKGLADGAMALVSGSGTVIDAATAEAQVWSSTAANSATFNEGRWEAQAVDCEKAGVA